MNPLIQLTKSVPLFVIAPLLACLALLPRAQAVVPAPDGGYPGFNTAEGQNALFSLTSGVWNTALGFQALNHDTAGAENTATGARALFSNTTGFRNTANGAFALYANTAGINNSAFGWGALAHNALAVQFGIAGNANTAVGSRALEFNTFGSQNTAVGVQALFDNGGGDGNTAVGYQALQFSEVEGFGSVDNTAIGYQALQNNAAFVPGTGNTAVGSRALQNNQGGDFNIGLGESAGLNLTSFDSNNIDIGNRGVAGESGKIRIGTAGIQNGTFIAGIRNVTTGNGNAIPVLIDSAGQLGTMSSSRRFKTEIKPMNKASEAILALKPVTFHYRSDKTNMPQFGLIAEEVAEVNPDLVVRDKNGEIYTVRYEAVNAMLLNEFLKEHRKFEEQSRKVEQQEATIAQLKKDMEVFVASLKEQAAQIQKVSAQLDVSKTAPQVVLNNQ